MKVCATVGYGLLATGYLARHKNEGIISAERIAEEYNLPLIYLLKVMRRLVEANLLRSKRGPHGGFFLAKSLNKISMLQVIEAVDGPMQSRLSSGKTAKWKFGNKTEQAYAKGINQAKAVLQKTKISDLV